MSLSDQIKVNTHYTRSINMERDIDSQAVVDSYIPTTRAIRTFDAMADALLADETPRAWSLVGPYGSGKSSFAVFLAHLLSGPNASTTKTAQKKLRSVDSKIANKYSQLNRFSEGCCTVLLTGSPESLAKRLIESLAETAEGVWANKLGRKPAIVDKLWTITDAKEAPSTTQILECIDELQDALARIDYNGLLIVIDELGKFLEYEARHYGSGDIYLLQALAEHAVSWHDTKLSLVVMMHQAFEQYARGLGESLRNEWAKVQGRFENIPFIESAEQVLRIAATAIEHNLSEDDKCRITSAAKKTAKVIANANALPGTMDEATATDLFSQCYPLHPVSALLLPLLCQKIAQNERTLFSYLGSREQHGFKDSISRIGKIGEWIYPWEIYEYFILNQSATLADHFTHRRWAEVVTATDRLGDAQNDQVHILKTIGLLNIIGTQGGFKASKQIVSLCLPDLKAVEQATVELVARSIIQFRKFSGEYRVWQGSDFDLDACIETELAKIGRFNLAESLNRRHALMPIVARKYSIQNGALRYFTPIFADAHTVAQFNQKVSNARVVFYLAENISDAENFKERCLDAKAELDIRVLCINSDQLRESTAEVLALETIQKTAQELNSDPVAQREFKDRYAEATTREEELLDRLTSEPELNPWFWKTEALNITSKRSLQEELSRVLKATYHKSPIFKNELLNRDKPSSQANAAKKKLAMAMFNNEGETDLGIDKFPPEKAIYRACLRESKLHVQQQNDQWVFQGPKSASQADDPCNINPVWQRIDNFLDNTEQKARSLIELNLELMAPPYGIKEGMLPILYMAALMANQQELAIYEERIYTPYLTEEQIERFLKRPDEFTVQRFRISGLNRSIHEIYSSTLFSDGKQRSMLALTRPLAKMILTLPDFTQTTKASLSPKAQTVRNLFKLAKSPIQLMLEELPKALDIDLEKAKKDETELKHLSQSLMDTLRELQHCLPNLKEQFKGLLAQAFSHNKNIELTDLREAVAGRCRGLEDYTIDRDGLKAFIQRALRTTGEPEQWLNDLLSFLGQKPAEKWTDADRDAAEYRLTELTRKLSELERLRLHYQGNAAQVKGDFDVYLLRSVKKGAADHDEVIAIDTQRHNAVKNIKFKMYETLKGYDSDLKMAALAEFVDEFLTERNGQKEAMPKPKVNKTKEGH